MSLATLPERDALALMSDLDDIERNPRVRKFAPVTVLATCPHACKTCGRTIPAGPMISRKFKTTRKAWNWYWHPSGCAPFTRSEVRPLPDRRLLAWAGRMIARAGRVDLVPGAAWLALEEVRMRSVPF